MHAPAVETRPRGAERAEDDARCRAQVAYLQEFDRGAAAGDAGAVGSTGSDGCRSPGRRRSVKRGAVDRGIWRRPTSSATLASAS
jgi:hypothetical protein